MGGRKERTLLELSVQPQGAAMASIICEKCRVALEVGDDGKSTYDVEDWANDCEHQAHGTPLLCLHMKAAIEAHPVKPNNGSMRPPQ